MTEKRPVYFLVKLTKNVG